MPVLPTLGALLAVCTLALSGCSLPRAESKDTPPARAVELTFGYQGEAGDGFIDQTLTITNKGSAAGAPDLEIVALDAEGAELPDVDVVTAFGTDDGGQVVPAYTEVTDILKFKGAQAGDVADVKVTVVDPGTLPDDPPPANDLQVKRFDLSGKSTSENTLGSVLIVNTYDKPIKVKIVGIEFADAEAGDRTHFKQVSPLAGPLELEPGEKVRERIADKYRTRFFASVRAYLVK